MLYRSRSVLIDICRRAARRMFSGGTKCVVVFFFSLARLRNFVTCFSSTASLSDYRLRVM